jgi:drug/metabolite transporter (DMT)-like permease
MASIGFAVAFPLMKVMFESGLTVWQILVPRYLIGTAVIWAIARSRHFDWRRQGAMRKGAVLGVVNVALPTILMSIGTDLLPSSVAGVLTAFIPMTTVAAAHYFVPGERFSIQRVPGLVLATAGVVVLVLGGRTPDGERIALLGVVVFLLGVTLAGVGGALNRRFAMQTPATSIVLPQFWISTAIVAAIGVPLGGADLGSVNATQWLQITAFGLVSTAMPFFALLKASELATAARASLVGYLVPLMAAGLSIVVLDDPLSVPFAAGAGLVVAGVLAADRADRRLPVARLTGV